MGLQKYRADIEEKKQPNGAIPYLTRWMPKRRKQMVVGDKEKLEEVLKSAQESLTSLYPAIRARHFMLAVHAPGDEKDMYSHIIHAESGLQILIEATQRLLKGWE
jgi:hypothetical protein